MKAVKVIKKGLMWLVAIVFFAFAIAMTVLLLNFNDYGVTQFDKTTLILIKGPVSSENYKKGDLVVVEGKTLEELKEGEEVFAYKVDKTGKVSIDLGKIGELHENENALSFENGATYSMDFVVGKSSKVYNKIGTYLSIIESQWGFLFIVLVPSFLIFIYQIYALIVEIKYGKEETQQS